MLYHYQGPFYMSLHYPYFWLFLKIEGRCLCLAVLWVAKPLNLWMLGVFLREWCETSVFFWFIWCSYELGVPSFIWMFCGFIWCSYELRRMPPNIRLYFASVDSMILLRPNKVHHLFFSPGSFKLSQQKISTLLHLPGKRSFQTNVAKARLSEWPNRVSLSSEEKKGAVEE